MALLGENVLNPVECDKKAPVDTFTLKIINTSTGIVKKMAIASLGTEFLNRTPLSFEKIVATRASTKNINR